MSSSSCKCKCAQAATTGTRFTAPALLYVGACTDAFPLTCPELRRLYPHIIYSDTQPAIQYWRRPTSEADMLEQLCIKGGRSIGLSPASFRRESDGVWSAALPDGARFTYYMNCDNVSSIPVCVLNQVTALYLHGYLPPVRSLKLLPNVWLAYATPACRRPGRNDLYWEVFDKSGLHIQDWIKVTRMDQWSVDKRGFYRDDFEEPPRFQSDAFTRTVLFLDSDSDSDDEA